MKLPKSLKRALCKFEDAFGVDTLPTGSRYFGVSTSSSDYDYFCYVPRELADDNLFEWLESNGWTGGGSYINVARDNFQSFRYGDLNLIVCLDKGFFNRFRLATSVCKSINGPKSKKGRQRVFKTCFRFSGEF